MTTGKTIALTRQTFVSKVMSLLFNMLSMLAIAFLPRSKHLLISWLQSPSAVILEPKKIKSVTFSTVSTSICHEMMGPDAMIFAFWMLSFKPSLHECSLGISNFLEEISSLSHSIAFLYLIALITYECLHVSPWYSLELHTQMGMSFLSSSVFQFSYVLSYVWGLLRQPFCPFYFFFLGWFWSPSPVKCNEPLAIVLQALCQSDLIPFI